MRIFKQFILSFITFLPLVAHAEIKTVTHTLKQPFGGSQSPDDARTAAIARAKREALEKFGTYIESTTIVKNSQVDSDDILALTAGVTKAEVIKQKNFADGDAFGIELTVMVELDSAVLEESLKRLLEDRRHLQDLKHAREREKKLLAQIAELQKESQLKGNTDQQSAKLKRKFQHASQELLAIMYFDKAAALWDGKNFIDTTNVIVFLTKAISYNENYFEAYFLRALVYHDLKQSDLAILDFNQAIRIKPDDFLTYFGRGMAYAHLNKRDHAIEDFTQTIKLNPEYSSAYFQRGSINDILGESEKAIADYNQAIRLTPNDALAYRTRGMIYSDLKRYDLAIEDYGQAIRLNQGDTEAYFHRGKTYVELQRLDRAIADFNHAIRLDPNYARAYRYRGLAYYDLKQFDSVIADLSQAIRIDPKNAASYFNRGNAYKFLNMTDQATADYDEAIRLDPKDALYYNNRGAIYLSTYSWVKGCADMKAACSLGKCNGYESTKKMCSRY